MRVVYVAFIYIRTDVVSSEVKRTVFKVNERQVGLVSVPEKDIVLLDVIVGEQDILNFRVEFLVFPYESRTFLCKFLKFFKYVTDFWILFKIHLQETWPDFITVPAEPSSFQILHELRREVQA